MSLKFARNIYSSSAATPIDADAQLYLDAMSPAATTAFAVGISSDFESLKSGSNNFTKIERLLFLDNQYEGNALINAVNPGSSAATKSGSPFWTMYQGFRAFQNGDRLNSGFTPSTATKYALNSACFFYWCNSITEQTNAIETGVLGGGSTAFAFTKDGNNNYSSVNDNSSGGSTVAVTTPYGFWSYVRINSTTIQTWHNGVLIKTSTFSSNALSTLEFRILCLNNATSYTSRRQLSVWGVGTGTIDQAELYATMNTHRSWVQNTPIPAAPNPLMKLTIPALTDSTGNGYNSVLGGSLPSGFTAPSQVGSDLVFSGNQTITLNSSLPITNQTAYSAFLPFYSDTPVQIQNLFQLGQTVLSGARIYTVTGYWTNAGGVYSSDGASSACSCGIALPKIQTGWNVFGISFSSNRVQIYLNGVVSYFDAGKGSGAASTGGWLGGLPSTAGFAYTLPCVMTLKSGTSFDVYDYTMTQGQLQAEGDRLMGVYGLSQCVFWGDSITEGFTVTPNTNNWTPYVGDQLIANTPYNWSFTNLGVPSRTLQSIADNIDGDGIAISYNVFTMRINKLKSGTGTKNICILLAGVNDIAAGRTLAQMQANFITVANFMNGLGYQFYAVSITGDAAFSGGQETIRLNYNSWLAAQEATYNYIFINTCADPNIAGQPPGGASTYFSDGVHYTPLTCTTIVGPTVYTEIAANL